jgi:uncharacterized lipoprotein YmbA
VKRAAAIAAVALGLACSRSGEPSYHALFPEDGAAVSASEIEIELRRPSLPRQLDRPQVVRPVSRARLELSSSDHWGAPLDRMVSNTLAENLSRRLPRGTVLTEQGAISITPDVRVEIDLRDFGLDRDGRATLAALVALHFRDGTTRVTRYALSERPDGTDVEAMVVAMSRLLGELSTKIAWSVAPPGGAGPAAAASPSEATAP